MSQGTADIVGLSANLHSSKVYASVLTSVYSLIKLLDLKDSLKCLNSKLQVTFYDSEWSGSLKGNAKREQLRTYIAWRDTLYTQKISKLVHVHIHVLTHG